MGVAVALGALVSVVIVRRRRVASAQIAEIDGALSKGDVDHAEQLLLGALADRPDSRRLVELRVRLARVLLTREEFAGAERVCADAIEEANNAASRALATVERARILAAQGRFLDARTALESADGSKFPAVVRWRWNLALGEIALAQLRFDEAERALAQISARSGEEHDEAALLHAHLQFLRGNFRQATAEIDRILSRLGNETLLARALYFRARTLLEQDRPDPVEADKALGLASAIARFRGDVSRITSCQALTQAHFGNEAEALELARRAPGLTVSRRYAAQSHSFAGDALRHLGHYLEARTEYQAALGLDSDCIEALWGLGACAQMFGHFEVAETYFRLCVEKGAEHFLGQRAEAALEC